MCIQVESLNAIGRIDSSSTCRSSGSQRYPVSLLNQKNVELKLFKNLAHTEIFGSAFISVDAFLASLSSFYHQSLDPS